jgi:hypothetical protein
MLPGIGNTTLIQVLQLLQKVPSLQQNMPKISQTASAPQHTQKEEGILLPRANATNPNPDTDTATSTSPSQGTSANP